MVFSGFTGPFAGAATLSEREKQPHQPAPPRERDLGHLPAEGQGAARDFGAVWAVTNRTAAEGSDGRLQGAENRPDDRAGHDGEDGGERDHERHVDVHPGQ